MQAHKVEVAAVLITGQGILAVLNRPWGSFTLPMTKRRKWLDAQISAGFREEDWQITATRAVAEVLGRTFTRRELPKFCLEVRQYKQSDMDGQWKVYDFQVFTLAFTERPPLAQGVTGEWLSREDLRKREPISPTTRYLLTQLEKAGKLPRE